MVRCVIPHLINNFSNSQFKIILMIACQSQFPFFSNCDFVESVLKITLHNFLFSVQVFEKQIRRFIERNKSTDQIGFGYLQITITTLKYHQKEQNVT